MLSSEEAANLWQVYKSTKSPGLKDQIILKYLPLVRYVAGRVAITLPPHVELDDLISYGVFGLMEAVDRFLPERGVKFETYAVARIRGAILDGLRAFDWVPVSVRQRTREVERAFAAVERREGRAATDEEVREYLGLSEEEYQQRLRETIATSLFSLDELWGKTDDEKPSLGEALADEAAVSPEEHAEMEDVKRLLAKAIDELPEKERLVIALYYYEGLTAKEIALTLRLSQSRISQLHSKAVMRLRGKLSRVKTSIL
ncbi:MAG: FliA/WhiG family RNA polymerase sigma factor [Bacillota bacterium]